MPLGRPDLHPPGKMQLPPRSGTARLRLVRYTQPIRQAVVVGEEARDLNDVVHRDVAEPHSAQGLDVGLGHRPGRAGKLDDVVEHRPVPAGELGAPVVRLDRLDQRSAPGFFLDLGTEVLGVRLDSVVAVVSPGDDDRDHLALAT